MKKILSTTILLISVCNIWSQNDTISNIEHINTNKFRQLYQEFATPNVYRNASGAPGHEYYQQQADYKINVVLDEVNDKLTGSETITYSNNSPDNLDFLWLQLDQNKRAKNSDTPLIEGDKMDMYYRPSSFAHKYLAPKFDGGFNITKVTSSNNASLDYTINKTMMRIDLKTPLKPNQKIDINIDWWYNINEHIPGDDRSGYELFKEDGNKVYIVAQFYPRMCVYNDVEGWQNTPFLGDGEFALNFGDYDVSITTPKDHMLEATGELQNRPEVYTATQLERYKKATNSFDAPVFIVTQEEAAANEKTKETTPKTWRFKAKNVRDFAFATSRKFISDMMAVDVKGKKVMAVSVYPKEGNPLWEEYSTKAVKQTLETYSRMTFQYPYPKAVSVHFRQIGMEYPMICWNYGRPKPDGTYSDRIRNGMISVIIHEVGHNFFPMIVNSDERQWGWMDEGLNSFLEYLAEQEFEKDFPSRRGPAENIIPYMSGAQDGMVPIMSMADNVIQLGNNAYGKPATALNILRETIMGHELFDHAFRTYSNRWKFKHPTPEDFFRTMEDASAMDLDWFWRGWFYTTDPVDIGIKEVKKFYISQQPNTEMKAMLKERNIPLANVIPLVYPVEENSKDITNVDTSKTITENSTTLRNFIFDNFTPEERNEIKDPKYFYEVVFNKPGGLVMPLIVKFTYEDGSSETIKYPAQVWRKNDKEVSKLIPATKKITKIEVDPNKETSDINKANNTWPKEKEVSQFDQFKQKSETTKKKKEKKPKKNKKKKKQ